MKSNRYLALVLFFAFSLFQSQLSAQDLEIEEDGEVQTGEIVIEKDRKIVLPQARKIYEKIKPVDFETQTLELPNEFKTFDYSPAAQLPRLNAARPKFDTKREEDYNSYIKGGFGNFGSPLLIADLGLITDKTRIVRATVDHLSFAKGAVDGKNSASAYTRAGADARFLGDNVTFSTGLGYTLSTDHFYGYQSGLEFTPEEIRHKYNFFDAYVGIEDANSKNDADYSLKVGFESTKDNYSASETLVNIGAGFNFQKMIFVDAEFITSKYTQALFDLSRGYLRLNPYYRLETGDLLLDAGFSFSTLSGGSETFGSSTVFPFAKARYSISESFSLYAQLDGGIDFNSYTDYAKENPFLDDDLNIESSRTNYDFKAGMSVKSGSKISLGASAGLKSVKNFGQYIGRGSGFSPMTIFYLEGNTKIINVSANILVDANKDNQFGLGTSFRSFSTKEIDDFYHVPTLELQVFGKHKIMEKFTVGWDFGLLGGIKGLDGDILVLQSAILVNYPSVKLDPITELNLYLDYQVNDKIGVFIQLNNILNKNYERYLNFPMRGLQAKAGVSFRF
ncbi:MAG: TonB-dependent receptor [Cyclobacteriaceae bacterium]